MKSALSGLSLNRVEFVRGQDGDVQVFVNPTLAYVPMRMNQPGDCVISKNEIKQIAEIFAKWSAEEA